MFRASPQAVAAQGELNCYSPMIRYGILGFGLHAVRRLMPGFSLARNSRVIALSRRDLKQAQASAAEYNIPHAFSSAEELCHSADVDAIFVASPNNAHLEHVLLALEAGKSVLCEKPMGMNAGECRQMVESARRSGRLLGIAQVFRFEPSVQKVRERIAAGQVGNPLFVRSEFCFQARNHPRKWLTNAAIAGGGPIADIGVHCLDALRYILGDEVVRASAIGKSDEDSGDVEASAALALEFARGALGSVFVSTRAEYRTPLEVVGDAGSLRGHDAFCVDHPAELELRRGNTVERETISNADAYARQVDAFSSAVEGKSEFPVPGEEGWQNQEVLDAAFRSLKSGKTETVPIIRK
jgi:predicted dehydrogenase